MSCLTVSGGSSCRFAAASRRLGSRADEACARNRAGEVHVALPQLGHVSGPIPKHSSQSRHKASCRSGRCVRGAGRTWLIIDLRFLELVQGRADSRQQRSLLQRAQPSAVSRARRAHSCHRDSRRVGCAAGFGLPKGRDARAATARLEARIAPPWTGGHEAVKSVPGPPPASPVGALHGRTPPQIRYRNRLRERSVTSAALAGS
jgi:hypothetical protein